MQGDSVDRSAAYTDWNTRHGDKDVSSWSSALLLISLELIQLVVHHERRIY